MIKFVPAGTAAASYTVNALVANGSSSVEATATITVQASPCVEASPAVAISPTNATAYAGDRVTYTIAVTNKDSVSCSPRAFNLSSLLPANWTPTFSQTSLTLSPTSTASANMSKAIPSDATLGVYSVNAVLSGGSSSVEVTASIKVLLPPMAIGLSVTKVDAKNFTITAKIMQGVPVSGASVQFKMTRPDSTNVTKKATTDFTGQAVWNYRVGPKDLKGTYQVTAQVTLGTQTADSAVLSFSVQ